MEDFERYEPKESESLADIQAKKFMNPNYLESSYERLDHTDD